ncbi:sesquipedalian [Anaeramoeba flamelloides]|uniref:Sesquipedalian n=1 Tax=Anaeramoeba flamelloides TaxID=1746091 RepID=A0AAV7ZZG6_9EUKA|nr:sesquipedalian [Anaeramoeba flamelloides]
MMTTQENTTQNLSVDGFLYKQSSRHKTIKKRGSNTWKKRYFKLTNTNKLYYSTYQDSKPLAVLDLQDYQCFHKDDVKDRYILRLFKPNKKSLFLEFESLEQLKVWKDHIQKAISNCSRELSLQNNKLLEKRNLNYLKSGWLNKKGYKGIFKSKWKRRFFVLNRKDFILYYYKTERFEGKSQGSINLLDIMSLNKTSFNDEPYGLNIALYSSKRVYKIAADSQTELQSWIVAIQTYATNAYI